MLNHLDRQYLFVLPLPLCAPGINSRLFGIALCRTDANLNPICDSEILRCSLPYNALPSPAYLFSQKLNPSLLREGLNEYKFINCLLKHFDNDNLDVITFSSRHLQALNAISLRCFLEPDILQKPNSILDLKVALNVAHLFGNLKTTVYEDLVTNIKTLNLYDNENSDNALEKLSLLIKLFRHLLNTDYKITKFLLTSTKDKINFIKDAITKRSSLVFLENADLYVIKPLFLKHNSLIALCCNRFNEITLKTIDLDLQAMLAPLSILTKPRQEELQFNLNDALQRLENSHPDLNNLPILSYGYDFLTQLSNKDREFFLSIKDKDPRSFYPDMPIENPEIAKRFFLYRCENFKGTLTDIELNEYYSLCIKEIQKDLPRYLKEAKMLAHKVNENDDKEVMLLKSIFDFAQNL